ncbi:MAG: hypothetical protein ACKVU0_10140 [Saprospiraceae bacterium]
MDSQTDNWTYAEFHAFTMLYAANADGHITEEEEQRIIPNLSAEDFTRIKTVFQGCADNEALNLILLYGKKYCKNQTDKDKVLADMLAIYKADASFDHIERGMHQLFERMF